VKEEAGAIETNRPVSTSVHIVSFFEYVTPQINYQIHTESNSTPNAPEE
jgi:hypothetical protein